jgi:hypothetical protein
MAAARVAQRWRMLLLNLLPVRMSTDVQNIVLLYLVDWIKLDKRAVEHRNVRCIEM